MAELADAADSKSAEVYPSWGFDPPSRHQAEPPSEASSEASQSQEMQEPLARLGCADFLVAGDRETVILVFRRE
jgi:hypothetical protein